MRVGDAFLVGIFLFFIGSCGGYLLEVLWRRFVSAKKWINPGFLTGPYLPLYGFGVVGLFLVSLLPIHTGKGWADALIIILIMGVAMTLIEYITGLIFIKGLRIRLWDYSKQWGNLQGIICPLYSLFWLMIAAVYYFVIDAKVIAAVVWFVNHIQFAYVVGVISGIFLVDLCHAFGLSRRIKSFADEHNIVIHLEKLKEALYDKATEAYDRHPGFFFPLKLLSAFKDQLAEIKEKFSTSSHKKD